MHLIDSIEALEALEAQYQPAPSLASTAKELDHRIPEYCAYIDASPFVALATVGPGGLDCSPRGDARGFVRVIDDRTLAVPDRHGNNRIDSLRNIVRDPRVALLFLVPGSGTTLRVSGTATITDDEALRVSFAVDDQPPRTVIMVAVEHTYLQCARAIVRSKLWDAAMHDGIAVLPSAGQILQRASHGAIEAPRLRRRLARASRQVVVVRRSRQTVESGW